MKTVLFACIHNAGRSQMAAGWFNALADGTKARAISAGTEPGTRVHPEVVTAMREVGIELEGGRPQKLTDELAAGASILVTMGCGESCPVVPGLRRMDWPLEDPKGKPVERVREIRDEVRARVADLLKTSTGPRANVEGCAVSEVRRVLFLCTGNSARSQMAEAVLRHIGRERFEVFSAGTNPRSVHPMALETLRQNKVPTDGLRSKHVSTFEGMAFDYVITLCDRAREQCTSVGSLETIHWSFPDPTAATDPDAQARAFAEVLHGLEQRLRLILVVTEKEDAERLRALDRDRMSRRR
jgi:arsenate reductase